MVRVSLGRRQSKTEYISRLQIEEIIYDEGKNYDTSFLRLKTIKNRVHISLANRGNYFCLVLCKMKDFTTTGLLSSSEATFVLFYSAS